MHDSDDDDDDDDDDGDKMEIGKCSAIVFLSFFLTFSGVTLIVRFSSIVIAFAYSIMTFDVHFVLAQRKMQKAQFS